MGKVNISEKEICKKEIEFYIALGNSIEDLRKKMYGLDFPTERLDKDECFPMEVELLNEQFKALNANIWRVVGEKNKHAYHK